MVKSEKKGMILDGGMGLEKSINIIGNILVV